eukprot:1740660-Prymnesium_polylepis.2
MPADASAWPMLALTPPSTSGSLAPPRRCSTAALSAPTSIGSPSAVPVPCASAQPSAAGAVAASASRAWYSFCCAAPLGD